jgi:hypothetical protein
MSSIERNPLGRYLIFLIFILLMLGKTEKASTLKMGSKTKVHHFAFALGGAYVEVHQELEMEAVVQTILGFHSYDLLLEMQKKDLTSSSARISREGSLPGISGSRRSWELWEDQ